MKEKREMFGSLMLFGKEADKLVKTSNQKGIFWLFNIFVEEIDIFH